MAEEKGCVEGCTLDVPGPGKPPFLEQFCPQSIYFHICSLSGTDVDSAGFHFIFLCKRLFRAPFVSIVHSSDSICSSEEKEATVSNRPSLRRAKEEVIK